MTTWLVYRGDGKPSSLNAAAELPAPPSWRTFHGGPPLDPPPAAGAASRRRLGRPDRAAPYQPGADEIEMINAALCLRRPLLLTGKPGTGKSTLAFSVAHELALGPVLYWPITSATTSREGLYTYDAIARLQDAALRRDGADPGLGHRTASSTVSDADLPDIGRYVRLGPLGTAFLPYRRPRVLLIDELDKSDIDLPNDLLTLFEEGAYEIPELTRVADHQLVVGVRTHDGGQLAQIEAGQVECLEFPLVIITSNGERDFPPPFKRRCLQLEIEPPDRERLTAIVEAHLSPEMAARCHDLIDRFLQNRADGDLATDQLLNAIFLRFHPAWQGDRDELEKRVMHSLRPTGF